MSHKVQFNTLFYSTFTSVIFSFLVEGDNVTSYADGTTPYSNGENVVTVSAKIETKRKEVVNLFYINFLKTNPDKPKLTFNEHVSKLHKKASNKLHALARQA